MQRSRRGLVVGWAAFMLALTLFLGTMLQIGLVVGDAWAQSSVRPPDDAVQNEVMPLPAETATGGEVQPGAGSSVRPPEPDPTTAPNFPGISRQQDAVDPSLARPAEPLGTEGVNSDSTLWGEIRHGAQGTVSIPNEKLAVMIQPGDAGQWNAWRSKGGPLQTLGLWLIGGMLVILVLFFLFRGRIRIEHGKSGIVIERFTGIERFAHWTLAVSFILLAISGLNLLFGKDYILPLVGKEAFATVTMWGKWVHTNISWAFMLGLVMVFVMWVVHNIPTLIDLKWFMKAGGLFSKHSHPSSRKFNGGQKVVFWATILLGASAAASGLALLFPFELPMFAKTFAVLNSLGAEAVWGEPLPTQLTPIEEQQYAQIWHSIVTLAMIAIILAHIYIGTIGMEGAFDAMGSGMVDRNWAKEHHDLWVEREDREAASSAAGVPRTQAAE